jgi:hypothetical protein
MMSESAQTSKISDYVKPKIKPAISSVRILYDTMFESMDVITVSVADGDESRLSSAIASLGTRLLQDGPDQVTYMNDGNILMRDENDGPLSFTEAVIRHTREHFAFCEEFKVVNIENTARVGDC